MQQQKRPWRVIIIALVALVLLIGLIALLTKPAKKQVQTGDSQVYNDPVSHQTVVSRKGAASETNGQASTGPVYLGFDKLLDYGVTIQQLDSLKYYFTQYQPLSSNPMEISLAVDDIQANGHDASDPQQRFNISSHIVVNRKTPYKIKFYYSGISSVQLYIYDTNGAQLFDSAAATKTNQEMGTP